MREPPSLDDRFTLIERRIAELEARLRAIDGKAPLAEAAIELEGEAARFTVAGFDAAGTAALAGRSFVLLAGAYLLRALSESGTLDRATGAALGLAYALALAGIADRVATRHRVSASFWGACAVLISVPLLWEITTRFVLLAPPMSALTLTASAAVVLFVAWRRDLRALAWIATVGGCALATGLLVATRTPLPFAAFLIALGIATLWLGYDREWIGLRWVAALCADFSIVALIVRALATPPLDPPASVMLVLVLSLIGYLGSIAMRTLVRRRTVLPFEAVQTAMLLAIGLVGSVWIARQTGAGALMLGPTLLMLAVASYAVALLQREWVGRAANYFFYTTLALVFAISSGDYLFAAAPPGLLWAFLAVGMSGLARSHGRLTLHAHAIVYLLVGAAKTGLAMMLLTALFGSTSAAWPIAALSGWLVAAAVPVCWWMSMAPAALVVSARVVRTMLMVLLVVTIAGVGVMAVRDALRPLVDASLHSALIATTRTAIFAAGAIVVAWLGLRRPTRDFGWLVYPLLGWGLLKLLFEDFRVSPPSLLFVAFALYGVALIVAPRVAKRPAPGT